MIRTCSAALVSLLFFAVAGPAAAQQSDKGEEKELKVLPDRPDVSESSFAVPRGHVQWEAGAVRTEFTGGHRWSMDNLFRIGVQDKWELRLGGFAPARVVAGGRRVTGVTDFVLGLKRHFSDAKPGRPSMGWLANVKFPTASAGFSNDHVEGNVLFVGNQQIGKAFELEVNAGPGVLWDRSNFAAGFYAVTLSYLPPSMDEKLRLFAEVYGVAPAERGGLSQVSAGAGVQYWVSPRVAVDAGAQIGLNRFTRTSAQANVYLGLSILK